MVQFRPGWPFDIEAIQRDMERLLDHVAVARPVPAQFSRATWEPSVDLFEDEQALTILVELAGVKPENVNLVVNERVLMIRGLRTKPAEFGNKGIYHVLELAFGHFARGITLPVMVDPNRAKASWTDGVLRVILPKAQTGPTGNIQIRVN